MSVIKIFFLKTQEKENDVIAINIRISLYLVS